MRPVPPLLPTCVLAALAACTFGPPGTLVLGGDGAEDVRAAIETSWREHIAAAQQKDIDGVLAIYAQDATYAIPDTPLVRGRDGLRAMEARGLQAGDVLAVRHSIEALRVDGDLAYELGSVIGDVRPAGQEAQRVRFHFVALWRLEKDGQWRILHLAGQTAGRPAR
jgi:uncharacterized protein (TIGR02246 family)